MSSPKAEILLVEDNPGDARLVQAYLEEIPDNPPHLVHVTRLEEARRTLAEAHVDAVLLDLGLPDCQGLETLSSLEPVVSDVPVVVLTGNHDERLRRGAAALGVADYLLKDELDSGRLGRILESVVSRSRLVERAKLARAEAETAQAQLTELVLLSSEPMLVLGPDRRVICANPAAGDLFGVDPRRLRRQRLPLPFERTRARHVELSDAIGRVHRLEVRAMSIRWREQPAHLVLLRPRGRRMAAALELPTHRHGCVAAAASELDAHTYRLQAWIEQARDHQSKLSALGEHIGRPGRTRKGVAPSVCRAETRRTMAELVESTRDALDQATDDLQRVRRLSSHLQRMSSRGRPVEMRTLDTVLRSVCDAVSRDLGRDVEIGLETGASGVFPRSATRTAEVFERLLRAIVRAGRERLAKPVRLKIRTQAHRESALVSLDIDARDSTPEFRQRVLGAMVGTADTDAPEVEVARCMAAFRELGGHARFGTSREDSLWLEVSVPDNLAA